VDSGSTAIRKVFFIPAASDKNGMLLGHIQKLNVFATNPGDLDFDEETVFFLDQIDSRLPGPSGGNNGTGSIHLVGKAVQLGSKPEPLLNIASRHLLIVLTSRGYGLIATPFPVGPLLTGSVNFLL